jgi:hypothetical protein
MEQIVTDVMIYWLTGSVNASWLYTAARRLPGMRLVGGAEEPAWHRHELRALACERPAEFVEGVRAFFREFRGGVRRGRSR